jgi:hypothetical protein
MGRRAQTDSGKQKAFSARYFSAPSGGRGVAMKKTGPLQEKELTLTCLGNDRNLPLTLMVSPAVILAVVTLSVIVRVGSPNLRGTDKGYSSPGWNF